MSSRKARIVGQEAFQAVFNEAAEAWRLLLGKQIQALIDQEQNTDVQAGLKKALLVVVGESK